MTYTPSSAPNKAVDPLETRRTYTRGPPRPQLLLVLNIVTIRRKTLLLLLLLSFFLWRKMTPTPPAGALGANFNEHLTWINHDELRRVKSQWVRGFIDMHQVDSANLANDPNLQSLFAARDAGFNTILSFKWNYKDNDFPHHGSQGHLAELECFTTVLAHVMGQVDILVIGNEPYIEAKPGCGQHLNNFYETMAETAISIKNATPRFAPKHTKLYMGSLNRLDLPVKRTPSIERMLAYIASQPDLAGVDLHLHMPKLDAHREMLSYALSRLRPDQTFLATEFSIVWHFKRHMGDAANADFCAKHGFPPGTKVHQVLSRGIQEPYEYAVWEEFLRGERWYASRTGFLGRAMELYRSTGRLEVATYGFCPMRFRKRAVEVGDTPWMLNGVYAPNMVKVPEGGERCLNFPWGREFEKAQR